MKKLTSLLFVFLLAACSQSDSQSVEIGDDDKAIGHQSVQVIMPQDGKAVHPEFGKEEWFSYGAVNGIGDTPANGVAQAYLFESGFFAHTAQINIAVAKEGYFYEGWLVDPETKEFISTGHLKSHFGDARHSLKFESEEDWTGYSKVVITLEPDDGDPAPAEHVAEGVLRHVKR